ncbi:MAG: Trk system potassium transporter TrkA [Candidatus Thermoplasmatota archaeon]
MYVIVGGAGEVGYNVARALREEGHTVTVVDPRADRIERLADLDVTAIQGNLAARAVLEEARVQEANLFLALTGDDEVNMLAAALAKTHGARTVARIHSPDYLSVPYSDDYKSIGIDAAVCPELVAAIRIKRILNQPSLVAADVFAEGKVFIAEGRIAEQAFVVGKRLDEVEPPPGFHLFAIYRGDDVILPKAHVRMQAGDRMLMALSSPSVLRDVESYIGKARQVRERKEVRRVMIAGATRIGIQLARLLEQSKRDVVLVEKDPALAREAGERLQRALVVTGDVTDRKVLVQENVDTFDAFVGATKVEEYNILGCLIAREQGVPLTAALVNQPELRPILEDLGIDLVVAPRLTTVGAILKQVHGGAEEIALQNTGGERLLVFTVREGAAAVGQKVRSLALPESAMLAAIVRGEHVIMPRGEDSVEAGDTVIAFSLHESAEALEALFA